ncbi:MAG: DNA-3-methyladenine glycosylase I [Candidatus Omnitrophica bacterium]|nr:DNA-3-methyladenine glycosylase I [Candidatus Omnitrophota bacterium]
MKTLSAEKNRCAWITDPLMMEYHDTEWGVPLFDDRKLFEFIVLDGMQAGLSWRTVLHKRENFRRAFDRFDPEKVARYTPAKVRRLLMDPGIIRNRLKVQAAVTNAQAFLAVIEKKGAFHPYIWGFVGGRPIQNRWKTLKQIPCRSAESDAMSRSLIDNGFRFVGTTICYAFMQAAGLVNDHVVTCFRYRQLAGGKR